jgi:hypothetical protein
VDLSGAVQTTSAMRFLSLQRRWQVRSIDFQGVSHIGRCMRTRRAWDDYVMQKNIEMGPAGSLTIAILIIAVVFLMRSFYKRFMGVDRSDDTTDK